MAGGTLDTYLPTPCKMNGWRHYSTTMTKWLTPVHGVPQFFTLTSLPTNKSYDPMYPFMSKTLISLIAMNYKAIPVPMAPNNSNMLTILNLMFLLAPSIASVP
jgi:hypothetical protein